MLPEPQISSRSSLALLAALALALTLLNAVKPLHIDDAPYYFDASQIAAHPLDPYGYILMCWDEPVPALHVLAPPVLLYWWAAAIRLFGERPILWKLWLFPLALLFVASLARLLRRFAPTTATPLLILLVLSPVFLPGLNLMIDIPALALSLTALVVFFRACDGDSWLLALLAGLTAGVAMQTKYTAFLAPPTLLVYAWLYRKMRLGGFAAGLAVLVFAAWEAALLLRYGESHLLYQLEHGYHSGSKLDLLGALFPLLGGVAGTLALLALTVLRLSRRLLLAAAMLVLLPYLLIWTDAADLRFGTSEAPALADALFTCVGAMVVLSMAGVAWRLVRPSSAEAILTPFTPQGRIVWFLVFWFGLELIGYVALSPFPAVRRIMGITVAATLLIGRLTVEMPLEPWRRNVLRGLTAATALLGFGFFAIDYLEARAEQQAAYEAVRRIRQEHPQGTIWYVGYWGFQFYAEQAGMKQAVPSHQPAMHGLIDLPASHFREGDWLAMPDAGVPQQELDIDSERLELMDEVIIADRVPLSTLMNYYAGAPPLRHNRGPRIVVRLFRFASSQ